MSSFAKKIQANQDKETLLLVTGKRAKHRCPYCHRFTLWRTTKDGKSKVCHWCGK